MMEIPDGELSPAEIDAFHRSAEHYADQLAHQAAEELAGRHAAAADGFDKDWGQFEFVHRKVLELDFDDGRLAYRYFLLSAELRRRRRPSSDFDYGAEAALRYARTLGPLRYAEALTAVAIARQEMSEPQRAQASAEEAVDVIRAMPEPGTNERDYGLAQALAVVGAIRHDLRQLDESLLVLGDALVIAERLGTREPLQQVLVNLGITLREMSDHEASLRCHQRALTLSENSRDLMVIQRQRANVADSLRHLGRLDEAREVATEALKDAVKLRDKREEGRRLLLLAVIALESGDLDTGGDLAVKAHGIAVEVGDKMGIVDALRVQAKGYELAGLSELADQRRREAAAKLEAGGRNRMAEQERTIADERQAEASAIDQALAISEKAMDALRRAHSGDVRGGLAIVYRLVDQTRDGDPALAGIVLHTLGRILTLAGRTQEALETHMEAADIDRDSAATVQNLLAAARLLEASGNLVGAIAAYERAAIHGRAAPAEGEPLGLALAALGRLAWRVNAYRAAGKALNEAAGLLRAAGSPALADVAADQRNLPAARAAYEATHPPDGGVLSDDALRAALQAVVTAWERDRTDSVTVRLNDGRTITGKLNLALFGTVPLLILRCQGRDTLLPVERAAAIIGG